MPTTPSSYFLPARLREADGGVPSPVADSSPLSSPDQGRDQPVALSHRPSHKRNDSSLSSGLAISSPETRSPDLDTLERVSGLGYSNSRPAHTRNASSLSSGIAQLPSPAEIVPAEEDKRRSALLSAMSSPDPLQMQGELVASELHPLVSNRQSSHHMSESREGRSVVTRKQVPGKRASQGEDVELTGPWTL